MTDTAERMVAPVVCTMTAPDLYRALQNHKRDDLEELSSFLDRHGAPGTVLDLGSGVGRAGMVMAGLGWQVIALDRDAVALERIQCALGGAVRTVHVDLAAPVVAERLDADAAVCLHHTANEIGELRGIFAVARSSLPAGAGFLLDVLTATYSRPYVRETVRTFSCAECAWHLETIVLPVTDREHDLHLVGSHVTVDGTCTRRVLSTLRRRVFSVSEVVSTAATAGFELDEMLSPSSFNFRAADGVPERG